MIDYRAASSSLNYGLHRGRLLRDVVSPRKEGSGSGQKPALQRKESLRTKEHPLPFSIEDWIDVGKFMREMFDRAKCV